MFRILLTGSTGMVGKGVLFECIKNTRIETIVLLNRSARTIDHPKIEEILLDDFMQIETIKDTIGHIDACFHCMGVSSFGLSEEEFSKITFDITKKLADVCFELNPKITFNYVSGAGTDSTEKGRVMWARVKGKTENYILAKGFEKAYMFRPGMIIPENGIKSRTTLYNAIYIMTRPLFPLLKRMKSITTTSKLGKAMIQTLIAPKQEFEHLENEKINSLVR